jgi:hypothetical protein
MTENAVPIHCNPYQNPSVIFHRDRKKNPKIHVLGVMLPRGKEGDVEGDRENCHHIGFG